jgi:anti-sigma factor RsiW
MTRDELEFAISQYLDGTLPAGDVRALEARLASDEEAKAILAEMKALDGVLKSPMALPAVNWEKLATTISAAVREQNEETIDVVLKHAMPVPHVDHGRLVSHLSDAVAGHMAMVAGAQVGEADDVLEEVVMRAVDGDLSPIERSALDVRLAGDPVARHLLSQHRALDAVVKHSWPLPFVDHQLLHSHLSAAVREQAEGGAHTTYKIGAWVRNAARLAMAACVAVAVGLAGYLATRPGGTTDGSGTPVADTRRKIIAEDPPEAVADAGGKPVLEISVGEPNDAVNHGGYYAWSSGLTPLRPRMAIAEVSHRTAASEGSFLPF